MRTACDENDSEKAHAGVPILFGCTCIRSQSTQLDSPATAPVKGQLPTRWADNACDLDITCLHACCESELPYLCPNPARILFTMLREATGEPVL